MIREFLIMLGICSVTVSAAALVFHIYARTLGKKVRAKWLYLAWIGILAAYLIPYRPAFDYREYRAMQADLITREELEAFPTLAVEIVETSGPPEYWNWIFTIWLTGFLCSLAVWGIRHARFIRLTQRWEEGSRLPRRARVLLAQVSENLRLSRKIPARICPILTGPLLTGLFRPRILLPPDLPENQLDLVFRHELIHSKRKDLWIKILILLAQSVHWFNPVIYLTARETGRYAEYSCDEAVLKGMKKTDRKRYAALLLSLAKRQAGPAAGLSTAFSENKESLSQRIAGILKSGTKRGGSAAAAYCMAAILMAGALLTGMVKESGGRYARQWRTNRLISGMIFDEYEQMGKLQLRYNFDEGKEPSWMEGNGPLLLTADAFDAVIRDSVDFTNPEEAAVFADLLLSQKYREMADTGFSDRKPDPTGYRCQLEYPKQLWRFRLEDSFLSQDPLNPKLRLMNRPA